MGEGGVGVCYCLVVGIVVVGYVEGVVLVFY